MIRKRYKVQTYEFKGEIFAVWVYDRKENERIRIGLDEKTIELYDTKNWIVKQVVVS